MGAGDPGRVLDVLRRGGTVVLTTHVHPDGDGIGAEVALAGLVRRLGGTPRIVNRDPVPRILRFLEGSARIERFDPAEHRELLRGADAIVMLDNSDPERLEQLLPEVRASRATRVCIDHHPDPDPFWEVLYVDEAASCTGQLVLDLWDAAGLVPDEEAATALYTALVSDTGRFRFANTTPRAFEVARRLLDLGVKPAEVYSRLEETLGEGLLRLFGEVLAGMEVRAEGRLVVLRVTIEQMERTGTRHEDFAEVINLALRLEGSRLACLFRELAGGRTKVSLRSKGELDVNRLARRHGGGGHRNASGIVLERPFDETIARLVPELESLARSTPADSAGGEE